MPGAIESDHVQVRVWPVRLGRCGAFRVALFVLVVDSFARLFLADPVARLGPARAGT